MRPRLAIGLLAALLPVCASGLGPHELLVIINSSSRDSTAIGEEFIALRNIPEINVLRLALPRKFEDRLAISPGEFNRLIRDPAQAALRERGIEGQVHAWVYSAGFPTTVNTAPPISIVGMTFVRGRVPGREEIDRAKYVSALFAGPSNPTSKGHLSQTFDAYREWLGADMPVPSMILGYTGKRGSTRGEVLTCLRRSRSADGVHPTGSVYFLVSDDIRSRCRAWQYRAVVRELNSRGQGVRAEIVDRLPVGRRDVLGLMMGGEYVADELRRGLLPGAMAEHLTSLAAAFGTDQQAKVGVWIAAGAAASTGTVAEPYSAWPKFTSARFYVHYVSGCTMIESLFQSIRSPLQILPVGDPLAQPWGPEERLNLTQVGGVMNERTLRFRAEADAGPLLHYGRYLYLLDGAPAGEGMTLQIGTGDLTPGRHVVRCVAYRTGLVRSQIFAERPFLVPESSARSRGVR